MYSTETYNTTTSVTGFDLSRLQEQLQSNGFAVTSVATNLLGVESDDCEQFKALAVNGTVTMYTVTGNKNVTTAELI